MKQSNTSTVPLFIGFVAACAMVAAGYIWFAINRATPTPTSNPLRAQPEMQVSGLAAEVQGKPYFVSLNRSNGSEINLIQVHKDISGATQAQDQRVIVQGGPRCDRIYFAADTGICLLRTYPNPFVAVVSVTVFGADLQPKFVVQSDGIPTRARVSRDGRYAAYTVFVTGHSYKDSNMSTKTIILDIARQREAGVSGNLESYQTYKPDAQGVEQPIAVPDFNFWGVTFSADSNRFYATLRTKGENWLVEGDIAERRIRMLRKDVECPTLSPDGKRIVFKKRQSVSMWPLPNAELAMQQDNPVVEWRLHVLDLATLQDKPLAELHNVDDQAEWLDNERILYELYDPNHGAPRTNVMVVNADGSGTPQVFLANAGSPVVIGR